MWQSHHTGNTQYIFPTLSIIVAKLIKQPIPCLFLVIGNNWIFLSMHLKKEKLNKSWQKLASAQAFPAKGIEGNVFINVLLLQEQRQL